MGRADSEIVQAEESYVEQVVLRTSGMDGVPLYQHDTFLTLGRSIQLVREATEHLDGT